MPRGQTHGDSDLSCPRRGSLPPHRAYRSLRAPSRPTPIPTTRPFSVTPSHQQPKSSCPDDQAGPSVHVRASLSEARDTRVPAPARPAPGSHGPHHLHEPLGFWRSLGARGATVLRGKACLAPHHHLAPRSNMGLHFLLQTSSLVREHRPRSTGTRHI